MCIWGINGRPHGDAQLAGDMRWAIIDKLQSNQIPASRPGTVKDVGQQNMYNLMNAADLIANKYRGYNKTHSKLIINVYKVLTRQC